MNRRPFLLVFIAVFYCLSPFLYPLFVSLYFGTPLFEVMRQTLEINTPLRNFETFIFPVALGTATFFARRISYFVVVLGSVYLLARNLYIFSIDSDSLPLSGLVFTNLLFIFVILYLSRRSTRAIYFNPKMRWWETDPRYIVTLPAKLARVGTLPTSAKIRDIAIGGAAIETEAKDFGSHESIHIEFEYSGKKYKIASEVVWERKTASGDHLVGIQWIRDRSNTEKKEIKRLIHGLKHDRVPTTRPPDRWKDFKKWISRPDHAH